MSKVEIIAELPRLNAADRAEVQAKLDELAADAWQDNGELTSADKTLLDAELVEYERSPNSGSTWADAKARIESKLRQ